MAFPSQGAGGVAGEVTTDVIDRASRLLGIIFGSQEQQILQRAATNELLIQLRNAGIDIDPREIRNLDFSTDSVDTSGSSVSISGTLDVNVTDRASRLLGIIFGSQGQQILQRAATNELLIQLRNAGIDIDPREIRNLGFSKDSVDTSGSSVSISGTPSVSISGTPSVSISGTPSVSISGTLDANVTDRGHFEHIRAIQFKAGEDNLNACVIDTTNGFAYFGTNTSPGTIIKVRLSDFTEVASITLPAGEDNLRSAVIDTINGFAYFGTNTDPGIVIKINLSTFTRTGSLTFDVGEPLLKVAVIDTDNGFAYFATDIDLVVPSKVMKVRLSDFTKVATVTLSVLGAIRSGVIDTINGFAYFGTDTPPGIIIKIDLSTFTEVATLTLAAGEDLLWSGVIDQNRGFAYFGTSTSPGIIVKINLQTFTKTASLTLDTGEYELDSAVIDVVNGFAYFCTSTSPGIIVKIRLSDFTKVQSLTLSSGENKVRAAVIDTTNGFAYFSTSTTPGIVVKVAVPYTRRLGMVHGSQEQPIQQDLSTNNLCTITTEHNQTHKGNLYSVGVVSTGIAILTPKRFLLTTPDTSIRAHLVYEVETQPGTTVELYENTTTSSDGTALSEICHRRVSPNVATVVATEDPTVTADGTLLMIQSSGTTTLGGKIGTVTSRANEFVLDQNTKYQIKITTLADNTRVSTLMEWYEI